MEVLTFIHKKSVVREQMLRMKVRIRV